MNYNTSIAISCVLVLIAYYVYRLVNWIWLRPKKMEKCLREQGFSGNPYRLLMGDQKESSLLIKEAMSKPIKLEDDIKQRVIPHVLQTIKNYGVNSYMWVGRMPRVHITEPELIKEVLVKHSKFQKNLHAHDPITKLFNTGIVALEGDTWSRRRRLLNMSFHFEKLKLMLPSFYLCCLDMVTKWENKCSVNGWIEVDAHHDFETLSGDVIARTLFGSNFEECEKIFNLIKELQVLTIQVIQSIYIPGWRFMPTKRNKRMKELSKEIVRLIRGIIHNKMMAIKGEKNSSNSSDFLGTLLESNLGQNKVDQMSIEDIIGDCQIFYFAGHDTSSALLSWTIVLLSRYPNWQTRAREEILQVFGNSKPDYDSINQLKIVTMILYEVLRLYPPAYELTKVTVEDTKLGELFLPAGMQVMIPTILLHHDSEIWGKDVYEFKPERFSEGVLKATKKQGCYLPFSLGPRICIGQNYALLEAKMALALILSRFWFELSPSYVHAPFALITVQPQFGVHVILHKL